MEANAADKYIFHIGTDHWGERPIPRDLGSRHYGHSSGRESDIGHNGDGRGEEFVIHVAGVVCGPIARGKDRGNGDSGPDNIVTAGFISTVLRVRVKVYKMG